MTAGAGARDLVGEVQRFGLFSAAAVVDRYAALVDRAIARDGWAPAGSDGGSGRPVDTAVQLAEAWLRLLDTTSCRPPARGGSSKPRSGCTTRRRPRHRGSTCT